MPDILALNAALEAAPAGGQGRGSAVVAGEVRSLAQRGATVGSGATLMEQSGLTIGEARDAIMRVTRVVQEIAAAAAEQSAGIDRVNRAVTQMDSMTQQNAALVEQAAVAAQLLEEQA